MSRLIAFWRSTLGKKVVMGGTGLIMIIWLVLHMAGNLQAFGGAEKLNGYAALLHGPAHELLLLSRRDELGVIGQTGATKRAGRHDRPALDRH